jgi:hypothetical protein
MQLQRDDERCRLVITVFGEFCVDVWKAMIERQLVDGRWHYATLYDYRWMTPPGPSADSLRHMAEHVRDLCTRHGTRGPVAVLMGRLTMFDIARMSAELAPTLPYEVGVFRNAEHADRWLLTQQNIRS